MTTTKMRGHDRKEKEKKEAAFPCHKRKCKDEKEKK